jgi:aspartate--ammonia ligase
MIDGYKAKLGLMATERGIKLIKDTFEKNLALNLDLQRVSAPRFLEVGNGLQDDLAGSQVPVSFRVKHRPEQIEIVHSLAKWKRLALKRYGFAPDTGLYTDMDAIRKDEDVSPVHSVYVDQWDWEKRIDPEHRRLAYLKDTVRSIYSTLLATEDAVFEAFPSIEKRLPRQITFLHTVELEKRWPDSTPKEREDLAAKEYGAYFLIGIGGKLASGEPHDMRAADYDDWITENSDGYQGLNGDIIVQDHTRDAAMELSSMGIRVSPDSLKAQLKEMGLEERGNWEFHRGVIDGSIPLSIGGGLGQSRICMLLLHKAHIGEVQASLWPEEMIQEYRKVGVEFL